MEYPDPFGLISTKFTANQTILEKQNRNTTYFSFESFAKLLQLLGSKRKSLRPKNKRESYVCARAKHEHIGGRMSERSPWQLVALVTERGGAYLFWEIGAFIIFMRF